MSTQLASRFGDISTKNMYEIPPQYICKYGVGTQFLRMDVQSFLYGFRKKYAKHKSFRYFFMGTKQEFENTCLSLGIKFSKVHPDISVKRSRSNLLGDAVRELYHYGVSKDYPSTGQVSKEKFLFENIRKKGNDFTVSFAQNFYRYLYSGKGGITSKDRVGNEKTNRNGWLFPHPDRHHFPNESIKVHCPDYLWLDKNPDMTGIPTKEDIESQYNILPNGLPLFLVHDGNMGMIMQDVFRMGAFADGIPCTPAPSYASEQPKGVLDHLTSSMKKHGLVIRPQHDWMATTDNVGKAVLIALGFMHNTDCIDSVNFLVTDQDYIPVSLLRVNHSSMYRPDSREGKRRGERQTTTQYSLYTCNISSDSKLRNTRDLSNLDNDFSSFFKKIKHRELDDKSDFVRQFIHSANQGLELDIIQPMTTKHIFDPTDDQMKKGSLYSRRLNDKEDLQIETASRDQTSFDFASHASKDYKRSSKWLILRLLIDNMTDSMKKNIKPDSLKLIDEFVSSKSLESAYTKTSVSLGGSTSDILESLFGKERIQYMFEDALPNYLKLEADNRKVKQSFDNYLGILPLGKNGCYGFMYLESYKVGVVKPDDDLRKDQLLVSQKFFEENISSFHVTPYVNWDGGKMFIQREHSGHRGVPKCARAYYFKHIPDISGFDKDVFSEQFTNLTFSRMEGEFDRDGFVAYTKDAQGNKQYRGEKYHTKNMCNYIPESDMVLFHQFYNNVYSNDWIIHPMGDIATVLKKKFYHDELGIYWLFANEDEVSQRCWCELDGYVSLNTN